MRSVASSLASVIVRLCAVLAVCAGLFFGGRYAHSWATTSPSFALKSISVSGTDRSDKVELARLAGLSPGLNLFRMDVGGMTRAVEQHPWVRTASVTRHFPSSVSLEVVEHRPAALAALGELYLLDEDGEPFKKLEASDDLDLPLVTGISRDAYVEKPEAAASRFRAALDLIALYRQVKAADGDAVSEVRVSGHEYALVTAGGTEIRLGRDGWEAKLARLEKVRAELRRRGQSADVIHLDNRVRPGWVAVKLSADPVQ